MLPTIGLCHKFKQQAHIGSRQRDWNTRTAFLGWGRWLLLLLGCGPEFGSSELTSELSVAVLSWNPGAWVGRSQKSSRVGF